jgi:CMP-2-keto-3-deoxyoctulosonic acid synthetase
MSKYLVTIAAVESDEYVTFAYGDFAVMNFAAKAGLKEIDGKSGDFSARVVEVEAIGTEDEKRTVVSVQGDAETVAVVLKKKVARERKEQNAGSETDSTDAPAGDDAADTLV